MVFSGNYLLGLGSLAGGSDIMGFVDLPSTEFSYCLNGITLVHTMHYYATIIAFNGATNVKNVTGFSNSSEYIYIHKPSINGINVWSN